MKHKKSGGNTIIAAERRRMIHNWALQHGSVSVSWLAEVLGVQQATIRNDLDLLQSEGKITRTHGGAIANSGEIRQPYSQIRNTNMEEKAAIGEAALHYLPDTGTIYIGPGSTCYEFVTRIPESRQIHVVTNAPEVAVCLASNTLASVELLGGRVRKDSHATDCLFDAALDMLFWDVTFISPAGIDVERGITSIDRTGALTERKTMEHGNRVVMLCDSSKIGQFSYAQIGPVSMVDVLITDTRVSPEIVNRLTEQGVEVIQAGPQRDEMEFDMEANAAEAE